MDLVTRIKDAILPDSTSEDTTYNVSTPPVSDAPGGFPDVNDATLGRQLEGENATSQNHKHRDSGVEVDHAPSSKEAESDAPATVAADETGARREETPQLQTQTRDSAPNPEVGTGSSSDAMTSVEEVKPHHLGNEGTAPESKTSEGQQTPKLHTEISPDDSAPTSEVGTGNSADVMTSVEEVKPHHLGNEGTAPESKTSEGQQTPKLHTETSPDDSAPTPEVGTGNSADAITSVEEVKPHHLGNERTAPVETQDPTAAAAQPQGVSSSTSEGTTSSVAEDPSTAAARPQTQGSTDQVFDAAHQQTEGRNATGARPGESGGGTHETVLGAASAVSGGTSADPNGGIHNGVFGAGSKDPEGEHFVSPHERTSQYRKGEIHSTISGVSESGLGRGGVHNGVIGHGSPEEEEDARRSSDASGQRAEASA